MHKRNKLSYFFLILFVFYYASIFLFQHTHILDGLTVVHSHIHDFSSKSENNHNHSEKELQLISVISAFTATFTAFLYIIDINNLCFKKLEYVYKNYVFHKFKFLYFSFRAPPISF